MLQLQQAVCEMRAAFSLALHQLGSLQAEEREERQRQAQARQESERQLAEALTLLITFKVHHPWTLTTPVTPDPDYPRDP